MSAFGAIVIEHFRHPRNRGPLPDATARAEGANPLCGDRIRVELRAENGTIADAKFSADACALCIASASLLTEHVRGMQIGDVVAVDVSWLHSSLEGAPPVARRKCVMLPLETLQRAVAELATSAS